MVLRGNEEGLPPARVVEWAGPRGEVGVPPGWEESGVGTSVRSSLI